MKLFEHKHYWYPYKSDTIINETKIGIGGIILEKCSCGAIRTIEYGPGKTPEIRIAVNK